MNTIISNHVTNTRWEGHLKVTTGGRCDVYREWFAWIIKNFIGKPLVWTRSEIRHHILILQNTAVDTIYNTREFAICYVLRYVYAIRLKSVEKGSLG